MTREEAIARIKDHIIVHRLHEPRAIYISEALEMAIQALSQINDIKAIINNPIYIQEDVLRYQMICEVVKE